MNEDGIDTEQILVEVQKYKSEMDKFKKTKEYKVFRKTLDKRKNIDNYLVNCIRYTKYQAQLKLLQNKFEHKTDTSYIG